MTKQRTDRAGAMSVDQQRFLELGRSLILDPEIVLLDDSTARPSATTRHCARRSRNGSTIRSTEAPDDH